MRQDKISVAFEDREKPGLRTQEFLKCVRVGSTSRKRILKRCTRAFHESSPIRPARTALVTESRFAFELAPTFGAPCHKEYRRKRRCIMSKDSLKSRASVSLRMKIILAAVACVIVAAVTGTITRLSGEGTVEASNPGTSMVTVPSTGGQTVTVTWTGTIPPLTNATSDCTTFADGPLVDQHLSTVNVPAGTYSLVSAQFRFKITWTPVVNLNTSDEILTVVGLGSSDGGSPSETVTGMNLAGGTYKIVACGFANAQPQDYTGTLTITTTAAATPTPTPSPTPPPPVPPGTPRFFNYVSPFGDGAGEPSIGSNWGSEQSFTNNKIGGGTNSIPNGGNSHYFGGFFPYMLHVVWDDCPSPANATFTKKPLTLASSPHVFGDPILFTDNSSRPQARTLVAQVEGLTPAGSATDITVDDGATFTPSEGGAPSRIDHETIGGGPFHAPLPGGGTPVYPHAIYYCSQSVADAACSLSLDGGVTFGPAVTIFTTVDCGGLHGHIKVAPDGTAYVPDNACGGTDLIGHVDGQQAVIVSEDNGLTWSIRPIPGSTTKSAHDNSVGVATDGTIYVGMQSGDGHPRIAVSHDKGLTWSTPFDVGTTVVNGGPVLNTAFPAVVAGDGGTTTGRATFAFYGTETGGSDYNQPGFAGVWYLYIATTFDGGVTWTTQNVTPGDPIQRNGICGSGTCRNLLDFFDATIDKEGRVLVGWDDGCIGSCVAGGANSFTAQATITRQAGGKRMFAAKDPIEPALPEAPRVTATVNGTGTAVDLSWPVPDSGGATITSYKVYRNGVNIARVNEPDYTDTTFTPPASINSYRVTAVNSQGEGSYCHDITIGTGSTETACVEPGITVINDTNADGSDADTGQNTPPDGSVNVRKLRIAEPFLGSGVHKLIFTLQVAPSLLTLPPPNSQWLTIWNAQNPTADFDRRYVAMVTNASGVVSFDFGKFGVPLDATNPNPNANTPVREGTAVGTYNQTTGVIRIEIPTSDAENVQPGQTLAGINVRTYFNRPDYPGFQRSQNNASDITANGSYLLVGNDVGCRVNQAPTAVLTGAPTSGTAPLLVNFDGSGSTDPDPGDSVAKYTFNFGDGTPDVVDTTSPTVAHTYDSTNKCPGSGDVRTCVATLTVRDQSGAQSANVATLNITVTYPSEADLFVD